MSILLTTKRRIVQSLSLVLLNTNLWAIGSERVCLPVMNCEACAIAWLGCPVLMMARSIAYMEVPLIVLACVLGVGLLMGRMMCAWVCPLGFLQDLLYKIPAPKISIPRFMKWIKYGFLLLSVVAVAYFSADFAHTKMFFCNFCPTAALEVVLPSMIANQDYYMDTGRILRFSVLAAVIIMAVLNHRSFCKIMCPIGALVAISNKFSIFSLKLDKNTCISCKKCDKSCPMDVHVMESPETARAVNRDTECIECLSCEEKCPATAISSNVML